MCGTVCLHIYMEEAADSSRKWVSNFLFACYGGTHDFSIMYLPSVQPGRCAEGICSCSFTGHVKVLLHNSKQGAADTRTMQSSEHVRHGSHYYLHSFKPRRIHRENTEDYCSMTSFCAINAGDFGIARSVSPALQLKAYFYSYHQLVHFVSIPT